MAIQNWMDAAKLLYLGDFEFPYFGKIATWLAIDPALEFFHSSHFFGPHLSKYFLLKLKQMKNFEVMVFIIYVLCTYYVAISPALNQIKGFFRNMDFSFVGQAIT